MTMPPTRGIALRCDGEGAILELLRDDFRRAPGSTRPARFEDLVTGPPGDAIRFLQATRDEGAAFGRSFDVGVGEHRVALSFAASCQDGELLIIGARSPAEVFCVYEALPRVEQQPTCLLQRAIACGALVAGQPSATEADGLEELAGLNNELVSLQRKLAKQNHLLQRLNREKDTFVGIAAHDLRNPIAAIQGYAKLLLEVELEPQQAEMALSSIVRSAKQMLALVNDLLDISVIESGKLELRLQRTCLGALVGQRLEFFRMVATQKRIEVIDQIDPAIEAEVDPHRFEQAIDNLVSNAIKYTPPGSRVWVTLGGDESHVQLSVRDEGPGISEEDKLRLFNPFSRLSAEPTGGERSTGLGLAITKQIILAHQGTIEVQAAPPRGSTFTVTQPRLVRDDRRPSAASDPVDRKRPAGDGGVAARSTLRRILLVDDDEAVLAVNQIGLEERGGYEVQAFTEAKQALAALQTFEPDLVLLDVDMPEMDGPAALAALREDPRHDQLPVMFLTARTEQVFVDHLEALGALAVLAKTLDPGELPGAVEQAWRRDRVASTRAPPRGGAIPPGAGPLGSRSRP